MRYLTLLFVAMTLGALGGLQPPTSPDTAPAAKPVSPAPTPSVAAGTLRVRGVGVTGIKDLDLSMTDLRAMPRRSVTVKEKDDVTATYEGVAVEEILTKAGLAFGQSLRGPRLREYLLAEAGDGYGVIFALPEISTEFSDRLIIVADKMNGEPLNQREGPLKVIVSDERKHARWVRNVTALTVRTSVQVPEKK